MANITASIMESIMAIMERNKKSKKIWQLSCVIFLVAAVGLGALYGIQKYQQHEASKKLEEIADATFEEKDEVVTGNVPESTEPIQSQPESIVPEETDSIEKLREQGIPIPDKTVDFEHLQASVNQDIYAWVYIPDTKIDYPILQHPDNNTYYLKYNLDGSKGYPGCIYTENYNTKDFTDPHTVLYGHNMKNGTMFAGLHKYADHQYFEEHPYVYIYTPNELLVYEIYAAYEYSNAHLLLNFDYESEFGYSQYLEELDELRTMNCVRKDSVEVTTQNRILTMATCIANKPDNRYLVQGVLVNED